MRTEEDLRSALSTREDLTPDPELVVVGARRRTAQRRSRRAVGAVAAAALVVAGVPVLIRALTDQPGRPAPAAGSASTGTGSSPSPLPSPVGPPPPFTFTISPTSVAGFTIQPIAVGADYEMAHIIAAPEARTRSRSTLFVYRPSAKAPAVRDVGSKAQPVRVNGAPAWFSATEGASAIRWQPTPGGWAMLATETGPAIARQTMIEIAEAVRFVAPRPARVPYRLSYLPAGLKPFHAFDGSRAGTPFQSVLQLQTGRPGPHTYAIDISVYEGPPTSARAGWQTDARVVKRRIAGHAARCVDLVDGRRCAVDFGRFTVDIGGRLPATQVERLVAGMSFADWSNPATWYPLDAAIPATTGGR